MDRILNPLRQALVETRANAAFGFSSLSGRATPAELGCFLLRYCHQAATLMSWLSVWNRALLEESAVSLSDEERAAFEEIETRLVAREAALKEDFTSLKAWLISENLIESGFELDEQSTCQGLKQVRHAQALCARRNDLSTWLCVFSEIERLRMVHGFTFIKLCELHFGKSMLKKLSHIHFQHQQQTALFDLIEKLLAVAIAQQSLQPDHALQVMKSAINGYGEYITNCYPAASEVPR